MMMMMMTYTPAQRYHCGRLLPRHHSNPNLTVYLNPITLNPKACSQRMTAVREHKRMVRDLQCVKM